MCDYEGRQVRHQVCVNCGSVGSLMNPHDGIVTECKQSPFDPEGENGKRIHIPSLQFKIGRAALRNLHTNQRARHESDEEGELLVTDGPRTQRRRRTGFRGNTTEIAFSDYRQQVVAVPVGNYLRYVLVRESPDDLPTDAPTTGALPQGASFDGDYFQSTPDGRSV